MNMVAEANRPKISHEEMERRRKSIRAGVRSNAIEGARHSPEIEPILEAYVAGEINASEMMPLIKATWQQPK